MRPAASTAATNVKASRAAWRGRISLTRSSFTHVHTAAISSRRASTSSDARRTSSVEEGLETNRDPRRQQWETLEREEHARDERLA